MSQLCIQVIHTHFKDSLDVLGQTNGKVADAIDASALIFEKSLQTGGKLLLAGNGTSAAKHTAELIGRFRHDPAPLPPIALMSSRTDRNLQRQCAFQRVFAEQLQAPGRYWHVFLATLTLRRLANVVAALEAA
jgi:phosphoheptose isomerase